MDDGIVDLVVVLFSPSKTNVSKNRIIPSIMHLLKHKIYGMQSFSDEPRNKVSA